LPGLPGRRHLRPHRRRLPLPDLRALVDGDQLEVLAIVIQAWVYAQQNPSYLDYLRRNA